ncbi:hypothetical protein M3Y99_00290700 [Aphelenchoides fujianensis]|nr:hypothetical protein M3Y99_00290700 [Aphelenchoides fujianensis]
MCATIVVRGFQFLREEHAPQWYGRLDEEVGGGRSSGQEGNPYVNVILKPQGRRGPADETEMLKH